MSAPRLLGKDVAERFLHAEVPDRDDPQWFPDSTVDESFGGDYMMVPKTAQESLKRYVPLGMTGTGFDKESRKLNDEILKREITRWNQNKDLDATHVLMNKGEVHIPPEIEPTFTKWYANQINQGHSLFFVERLTDVFRFFVDMDFESYEGYTPLELEAISKVAYITVASFFPSITHNSLMAASTDYKTKVTDGIKTVKTGLHLIWKHIFVTKQQALDIRESVKCALETKFGERIAPQNSWDQVVDDSVYASGLRMMYSKKTDDCQECKKNKKRVRDEEDVSKCTGCGGNGKYFNKLDAGRPYSPLCVLTTGGKRDKDAEEHYRQFLIDVLEDSKLRYHGECTPDYTIPAGAPLYVSTSKRKKGGGAAPEKKLVFGTSFGNGSIEREAIEEFIRTSGNHYKDIIVKNVRTQTGTRKYYEVYVSGYNSRYCQNIGREHKSNRIYFFITEDGMVQRCMDRDSTENPDAKYGLCSSYSSPTLKLSPKLRDILFARDSSILVEESNHSDRRLKAMYDMADALSEYLFGELWSKNLISENGDRLVKVNNRYISMEKSSIGIKPQKEAFTSLGIEHEEGMEIFYEPEIQHSLQSLEEELFTNIDLMVGLTIT